MKPLVSIITVSYNSEKTIRDTIESVLNQTYENIEYLIIDGKSKDRTLDIAESYKEQFAAKNYSYVILSEKDHGIYDAMNKGIALAKGEIIGIINSDDWYEPEAVERMIQTYIVNSFDMFYADVRVIKGDKTFIKHSRLRNPVFSRDWNHPTTFITKQVYQKYQYKLESLHDDWDLYLKIRKAGYKIAILNEVLANFRLGGASNEKNLKKSIQRGKARYKIYRNNGYSRWYLLECVFIETAKYFFA